ncbi:MAG: Gfo/Idh/MocA family oxidoreductase [Rhodothermaceae bacterium]|nr:Gfo/Idh/MocA family oxidoreductase [Rhodothermaceae bacterium]
MNKKVGLAQVGVGYWGKNLLRNFAALPEAEVLQVCDQSPEILAKLRDQYSNLDTTDSFTDILTNDDVDAVIIATQTPQHYELAKEALKAGKHVFVEKPLAQTTEQAEELVALADQNDLRLMVGHLLMYHPAFTYVEDIINKGDLGDIRYIYSNRVNLGIIRQRENAFESLAPHDLSLALLFLNCNPVAVSATGQSFLQEGIEDVAFATVFFENGKLAHLHTSWLDPHKIRKVTVVGSKKMAVIDDMESTEKVRLYDKGVDLQPGEKRSYTNYAEAMSLRTGDIVIPKITMKEPLRAECQHFLDCVLSGETPRSDGRNGLTVVRLLEAAQISLRQGGAQVELQPQAAI